MVERAAGIAEIARMVRYPFERETSSYLLPRRMEITAYNNHKKAPSSSRLLVLNQKILWRSSWSLRSYAINPPSAAAEGVGCENVGNSSKSCEATKLQSSEATSQQSAFSNQLRQNRHRFPFD